MAETPYSQHEYQYGYSDPVLHTDPSGARVAGDPSGRAPILSWAQFQAHYFPNDPSIAQNPPQITNAGHILTPSDAADYAEAYLTYVSHPAAYSPTARSAITFRASVFAEYFLHISLDDVGVGMALEDVQTIFATAKAQGRSLTSQESTCVLQNALVLGFAYGGMQNGLEFLGGGFRGFFGSDESRARAYDHEFYNQNGSGGGGGRSTDIPWSSSAIRQAASDLMNGKTKVYVNSRAEAEEIFLRLYQGGNNDTTMPLSRPGSRYINTAGLKGEEADLHYGRQGVYHWDDQLDSNGRLQGHAPGNADGQYRHLQIRTRQDDIGQGATIRIFYGSELPWQ